MTCVREREGAAPYPVGMRFDDAVARFGRRLYDHRQRRGLSAESVAAQVPCPVWTLFGWETGREVPNVRQIRQLARVLRLSEYELTFVPQDFYEPPLSEAL